MSYTLQWLTPSIDANKATPITVGVASTNSTAAPITFTGKGAANYGLIEQTNLMRVLENFAAPVPPANPTVGMNWYDSTKKVLNVCVSTVPLVWQSMGGITIGSAPPASPQLGDLWVNQVNDVTAAMYMYTGVGRYPATAWDAYTVGYYGAASTLVAPYPGILLNYNTFSTTNYNEAYIHGFSGATPADVDPQILVNGVLTNMPRGVMFTGEKVARGFIVWDTTATLTSTGGASHFFGVRDVGAGKWEYDTNSGWAPFTPVSGMYVVGTYSSAVVDTNTAPGLTAGAVWQETRDLTTFVGAAQTSANGAGGWEQIFPTVEYHGARAEFDEMLQLLLAFIGSPETWGGNGMIEGLPFPDLATLDASVQLAYANATNNGLDTVTEPLASAALRVEPNSQDWDLLLAAAKLALNRLDVPVGYALDVSPQPFTMDGLPPAAPVVALPTTDIRYPTAARLAKRRVGSVTSSRTYTETMNLLANATALRYQLKTYSGNNSTNSSPLLTSAPYFQSQHQALYTGGSFTTMELRFAFANDHDLRTFFAGGNCIDVLPSYTLPGSPTANDTNWQAFLQTCARIRISQDMVRVFDNGAPANLTQAPIAGGFANTGTSPTFATLATITSGSYSAAISTSKAGGDLRVRIILNAPSALGGTSQVRYAVIHDCVSHDADVPFFSRPAFFVAGSDDAAKDPIWTNIVISTPPTSAFSASAVTGAAPLSVNFNWTGVNLGAGTVDWDFESDGTVDSSGTSVSHTYTQPGYYTVTIYAGSSGARDALQRVSYIHVT